MRIKSVLVAVSLMILAGRADASPIGSVKWTYDVLLETASAFSLSSFETSTRVALLTAGESLSNLLAPLDRNRTTLLVSSVAAPLPPAFQEPSAWVIVLIGLGIVALGSIKRRLLAGSQH
jgi:hypothetical protein